ncbi:GNAT family N-acetyltransferase [Tersicoccus sp. Bi-70]|uniref:GNAT family N-acetyltransferase n=1 Tax=Tersicoccus sp. Bi-70 TaxID=1897634 RepID=UPI00097629E2|nr:GNAT family N-acetyltransferase [Tersicoccus sp. Bi-70]OMH36973.1 GNAT family N-acetyltransferase [Tersicoccus sp. Bi-70]
MNTPVIRRATADDADGIAVVHVRAWQQTYAPLVPPGALDALEPADRAPHWHTIITGEQSDVLVATVDDVVIGWATASAGRGEHLPRDRELEGLYVLAEHHGTGTGQALLDAAIGDAPAFLWVADGNPRAETFYRRNGFVRDGRTMKHRLAGHPVPAVRMVR